MSWLTFIHKGNSNSRFELQYFEKYIVVKNGMKICLKEKLKFEDWYLEKS